MLFNQLLNDIYLTETKYRIKHLSHLYKRDPLNIYGFLLTLSFSFVHI